MTTSNKPENQKNHDSLSDLGQITFTPERDPDGTLWCHLDGKNAYGENTSSAIKLSRDYGKERDMDIWATFKETPFMLCILLAKLTSTSKDDREWAKKRVREATAFGRAVIEEAFRRMREFEAQEALPEQNDEEPACKHTHETYYSQHEDFGGGYPCWICDECGRTRSDYSGEED